MAHMNRRDLWQKQLKDEAWDSCLSCGERDKPNVVLDSHSPFGLSQNDG